MCKENTVFSVTHLELDRACGVNTLKEGSYIDYFSHLSLLMK